MKKGLLLLLLNIALTNFYSATAQNSEIGLFAGVGLYSGDLSPNEFGVYFSEAKPAFGFIYRNNFAKQLSFRLGFTTGKISGSDLNGANADRGWTFQTNITEGHAAFEVNLFRLGTVRTTQVVPYIVAGAGVFYYNPQFELEDGNWVFVQPLGTEGQGLPGNAQPYALTRFSIPLGAGIKIINSSKFTLALEFVSRVIFTDYLDDVSSLRVSYLEVLNGNGEIAAGFSNPFITDQVDATYRRGGDFKDWFHFAGLSFSFAIGNQGGRGIGCPTF